MGALDPIAGISLERYAELCARMKDCGGDLEVCATIAEAEGVGRDTWQAAMDGWNARMNDPATAGQVALAYMPLYQAALARTGTAATASFEDYAGMSVMVNHPRYGLDPMYAHYGIDVHAWSQISTYWVNELTTDEATRLRFASETGAIRAALDAGQPPPPAGLGHKPAAPTGDQLTRAASAVASLPPVAVGENCYVLWGDGNKYPGQVKQAADGKCLIAFANGHQEWVPNPQISNS
jgi:hypothetical protein